MLTKSDLSLLLEFTENVITAIENDDIGVLWDLEDLALNSRTIVLMALGVDLQNKNESEDDFS